MAKQLTLFESQDTETISIESNTTHKKVYHLEECVLCKKFPIIKHKDNGYTFLKCPDCGFSCGSYYEDYIEHWNFCNKKCRNYF